MWVHLGICGYGGGLILSQTRPTPLSPTPFRLAIVHYGLYFPKAYYKYRVPLGLHVKLIFLLLLGTAGCQRQSEFFQDPQLLGEFSAPYPNSLPAVSLQGKIWGVRQSFLAETSPAEFRTGSSPRRFAFPYFRFQLFFPKTFLSTRANPPPKRLPDINALF